MENINRHNYESFFLDYSEGNLSEALVSDLKDFLKKHPNLKEELESFEDIKLKPEKQIFINKENLIKQTQAQFFEITQFEYLAVAESENDIKTNESAELKKELNKTKSKITEYEQIKKAKLKPDLNIKYPNKKELLHKTNSYYLKISSYAAAAVIAILLVLNQNALQNSNSVTGKQLLSANKNEFKASENIIKKIELIQASNKFEQEEVKSHNQTNKQTINKLLAFNDDEPHDKVNTYKELNVSIPDLKHEALILNKPQNDLIKKQNTPVFAQNNTNKEKLWQYAETGLNVWKAVSSSDLEMNNRYGEDGSIEKLNVYASNFKLSRTFNKN